MKETSSGRICLRAYYLNKMAREQNQFVLVAAFVMPVSRDISPEAVLHSVWREFNKRNQMTKEILPNI